ncbi:DM13 domain-containing protein [Micromonospora sp. NBC_00362]|uniref:DM13 domain-containing protein n=1 Tax=Micromonospora sp. NBC_00362 TaxID=2975975 RepID=UPI0022574E3A|nr:DM13 domain-containing protein [Micromonospora sp. NBC_00362]MCX5115649.1 DM13 domain-containing protein [Micromonospora sp. NBC_00362]
MFRSPVVRAGLAVVVVVAMLGLYWFQPWKLFTDTYVDEAIPRVAATSAAPTPASATPESSTPAPATSAATPAANEILTVGEFVTHEHRTTGTAEIHRLADGNHQLVIRDLNTSNGPDLRVWLTDQPVIRGTAGWRVFDDGEWVELAKLKGNKGNQVYELPASVDPADFRSVSIWCKRFAVSFGAADLTSA